jgi:hypothetical protein
MRRRRASFSLAGESDEVVEEADPRIGLVNLADVMLVLAVALMCSVINFWGVDVSSVQELAEEKLQQVQSDLSSGQSSDALSGDQYEEVGTVYRDRETGDLYMLED